MTVISQSLDHKQSLSRTTFAAELGAFVTVIRRNLLTFFRYPSWVIAFIIWPVIFPMAFILGGRALAGPDGSAMALFTQATGIDDFYGYVAVGTIIWMWQNMVLWDVGYALRGEQMRGTLETNWMTPTWRFSLLLGSSAAQMVSMLIFLTVSAVEFGLFFGVRFNGNPLLVVLVMLAAIPSIYGLGFAFASLVIVAKEANAFVYLVRGFVTIFCGISFPISVLPGWMQQVGKWIPPTYTMHGIRAAALSGATLHDLWPDLKMLILFGAFWLVTGYLCFNWMEHRARRNGTLGLY